MYCGRQHMENEQEAQQAIRSLNGHNLNGNRINVEVRRTCMEQSSYQHHSINLFAIFQETT